MRIRVSLSSIGNPVSGRNQLTKLLDYADKGYFLNFSGYAIKRVNPLGFRTYHSPTGIYLYPLKEFKDSILKAISEGKTRVSEFSEFNWAGKSPVIHIYKIKEEYSDRILDSITYTKDSYIRDIRILRNKYNSNYPDSDKYPSFKAFTDGYVNFLKRYKKVTYFNVIYNISRMIAEHIRGGKINDQAEEYQLNEMDYDEDMVHGSTGLELFKILKKDLGYVGVVDHGQGAIYSYEPEQGVVFDSKALQVIDMLDRRTHKDFKKLLVDT